LTTGKWKCIEELFHQALTREAAERDQFLSASCGDDMQLLKEVKRLLRASERENGKLGGAVLEAASTLLRAGEKPGEQIGPYRIERLIGRGGMGSVYLAVRADDQYSKRVAIKLLGSTLATPELIARFRHERQILASLSHPNIAQLLDGGATSTGLPYVVMEYVDGVPLDEYCQRRNLGERQRIELIRTVCGAVGAAHRALVVHRDLKPGNVLVTTGGECKLVDFGIAKMLDARAGEQALTQAFERLFTPEYAAPEQMRGEPAATSMDIYSLGVMLYTLLVGHTPHDLKGLSATEMERVVSTHEPPAFPGELGLIIGKAMHKDPERRYHSSDELSADLERHMKGYPVEARPDTLLYRSRKFVARNRLRVMAAVITASALLAAGISQFQAQRAARQQYDDLLAFSNSALFEFHDAIADLAGATRARGLLVARAVAYLDRVAGQRSADVRAREQLAYGYEKLSEIQYRARPGHLGDSAGAIESAGKALQLRRALAHEIPSGDAQLRLAAVLIQVAAVEVAARTADSASAHLAEAIRICESHPAGKSDANELLVNALKTRGELRRLSGDLAAAQADTEKVSESRERGLAAKPRDPDARQALIEVRLELADIQLQKSDSGGQALSILQPLLSAARELSAEYPVTAQYRASIASVLNRQGHAWLGRGDPKRAMEAYAESYRIVEQLSKGDPADARLRRSVAVHNTNLALALERQGQIHQAEERFRRSLEIHEGLYHSDPANLAWLDDVAYVRTRLGRALARQGATREALPLLRTAMEERERLVAGTPANVSYRFRLVLLMVTTGDTLIATGECGKGKAEYERARATLQSLAGKFRDEKTRIEIENKLRSPCRG
jgi:tetratricopeptide (TPR) repeat protein